MDLKWRCPERLCTNLHFEIHIVKLFMPNLAKLLMCKLYKTKIDGILRLVIKNCALQNIVRKYGTTQSRDTVKIARS